MGGVNTGAEKVYGGPGVSPGKPDNKIHYMQVDGRGKTLTLPELPPEVRTYADGGNGTYTVAITNASQVFQLPVPGAEYILIARGNTAYCLMGGAGAVATTAVGGHDFPVADGIHLRIRPRFTHIAFIGTATVGAITFLLLREP